MALRYRDQYLRKYVNLMLYSDDFNHQNCFLSGTSHDDQLCYCLRVRYPAQTTEGLPMKGILLCHNIGHSNFALQFRLISIPLAHSHCFLTALWVNHRQARLSLEWGRHVHVPDVPSSTRGAMTANNMLLPFLHFFPP